MPKTELSLAIVGATGALGRTALELLEDEDLPVASLKLLASFRSAGTKLEWRDDELTVLPLAEGVFRGVDVALFLAGADVARTWAPRAVAEGAAVVDGSPAFRGDADVPLVVPEVNPDALELGRARRIVASPGASAIALAAALAPIRAAVGIERLVVSTYESVSGAGRSGVEELERESRDLLNLREPDPAARFPHRIAFNVIPQVGELVDGGATDEERGLAAETRKVLGDGALKMTATAVRVPIFHGHSLAVNVATRKKLAAADARELLRKAKGVKVVDDPAQRIYPMPMLAAAEDSVLVGRLRDDASQPNGLDLFLVVENTRKGGATNALQLARLIAERWL